MSYTCAVSPMDILRSAVGFEWDQGNSNKNRSKHGVSDMECEEVFFNDPLLVLDDRSHSEFETRYYALGRTDGRRRLFVAFVVRDGFIRVISARDMTASEMRRYPG